MNIKTKLEQTKIFHILRPVFNKARDLKNNLIKKIIDDNSYEQKYLVKEIIMRQDDSHGYRRLDIFVRLLAVENEYGRNDYGWNLYRKMQSKRLGEKSELVQQRVDTFKKLIESYREKGYDDNSKILLYKNLLLEDGSHRLSLAIFYEIKDINCTVLPIVHDHYYGENWFLDNGFSYEEVENIKKRVKDYLCQE